MTINDCVSITEITLILVIEENGTRKVARSLIRRMKIRIVVRPLYCYLVTSLIGTPYALLVSVIIGVTNIIPFFGPFLGAVPCLLLILLIDPLQALYFLIFVVLLQQFDGNFLGPKILGETTGVQGVYAWTSYLEQCKYDNRQEI